MVLGYLFTVLSAFACLTYTTSNFLCLISTIIVYHKFFSYPLLLDQNIGLTKRTH